MSITSKVRQSVVLNCRWTSLVNTAVGGQQLLILQSINIMTVFANLQVQLMLRIKIYNEIGSATASKIKFFMVSLVAAANARS